MNPFKLVAVVGATAVVIASVACSSSSSNNIASACNINGTYKVHETVHAGSDPTCTAPADSTITMSTSGDAGAAQPGCTTTQDLSACSSTSTCKIAAAGFTTNVSVNIKFASDGSTGSGSVTSKTTKDADGSTLSNCSYDITYTRQ